MTIEKMIERTLFFLKHYGIRATFVRSISKIRSLYFDRYSTWYQQHVVKDDEWGAQKNEVFETPLLFSILIPTYNTQPRFLQELADSLLSQSYDQWEACFYDGASPKEETRLALAELAARDPRFKVIFSEKNEGISGNTNGALQMASGDYIALCDHDDTFARDALYCCRKKIDETGAEMIYTDEDKIDAAGKRHFEPHFKPGFSPDLLRERNYICHLLVIKRALVLELGGLRSEFDGSQDHDLAMRASEVANRVEHIPRILYHWRMLSTSMSHSALDKCIAAGTGAVNSQLTRLGMKGSAINQETHFHTVYEVSGDLSVTIIVVAQENQQKPDVNYREDGLNVDVMKVEMPEDKNELSAVLNEAIRQAEGRFIVILSDLVQPKTKHWIKTLVSFAQQKHVGMVTSSVYLKNRLVHAGYVVGKERGIVGRKYGLHRYGPGYLHKEMVTYNISAVSWAYCAFDREKWHTVGGFDENLCLKVFAVDICLRLGGEGWYHIYTPDAPASVTGKDGQELFSPIVADALSM